jgi:2-polyprenyl-6-methoxyphenol hydroxylase-like FAD-dependent oxidoreductase
MWAGMTPLPWTDGRVVLIGDAAHATTPHLGYGAGLAIEDGVALGSIMRDAPDIASGLRAFGERRYERCAMVVETGLRICKWQQNPVPGFDQAGESAAVWTQLAEPF